MSKKAVIIGINRYKKSAWNLEGCKNDAIAFKTLLRKQFKFQPSLVRLVLNERATLEYIEDCLEWLVIHATPGDTLVFFFSGHGSQVKDDDGDELDALDEILCPHDFDWDTYLTDDLLLNYFQRIPDGANLTVIFDCCHSGTAPAESEQEGIGGIARAILSPYIANKGIGSSINMMGARSVVKKHILFAACAEDEIADESLLEGKVRGVFSYYFMKTIQESSGDISYLDAHDQTSAMIMANGFQQTPQIEGPQKYFNVPVFT